MSSQKRPDAADRSGRPTGAPERSEIRIDRLTPDDQPAIRAMYARVFGKALLEESLRRWDWQYRRNPSCPPEGPEIWIARSGADIVGQYATMPVRLRVAGRSLRASWGMDVMVDPARQRRGIGADLFGYWNDHVDVSLGLGLSPASYALFRKLPWADVGPVPCYTRILTGRGLVAGRVPRGIERVAAPLVAPAVWIASRPNPVARGRARMRADAGAPIEVRDVDRFDASLDDLWTSVRDAFDLIVERDSRYLNWKFVEPPHVQYRLLVARGGGHTLGYAVYRVAARDDLPVGLLVDWLADPRDEQTMAALVDVVVARCRAAGAHKLRSFAMHAGFGTQLEAAGFRRVRSTMQFCARINDERVAARTIERTAGWHVTFGDSDQDRR